MISLCSSQWPCVVCGQKSYADCSLFSDAEWIAHSEQLCHSSQHPSLPPSHPSVTLHGVQRHHVGLCDRPHMAAAQWQCSLSPQLWHHHPAGLQELGCHARLRPFGRRLGPVTVLGARGGSKNRTERQQQRTREMGQNKTPWTFPSWLSRWTDLYRFTIFIKDLSDEPSTVLYAHILLLHISISHLHRTKEQEWGYARAIQSNLIWAEDLAVKNISVQCTWSDSGGHSSWNCVTTCPS